MSLFAELFLRIASSTPKIRVYRGIPGKGALQARFPVRPQGRCEREKGQAAFDANAAVTVILPWPEAGAETNSAGQ